MQFSNAPRSVAIPRLVRIKPGAIDRLGLYLGRVSCENVCLLHSDGLPEPLIDRVRSSLHDHRVNLDLAQPIKHTELSSLRRLARQFTTRPSVILGLGGGKALDAGKWIACELDAAFFSIPTSLSNDGFASPQSSLTVNGERKSISTVMPRAVIVDTKVCLQAPKKLWLSGVGDLVSKVTAVRDWILAFHKAGTFVDDFAALLSDASVYQFIAKPTADEAGTKLLATALMLNGVSMSICGSSRPASGSEHLISHALDSICEAPRLHGFQVGMATYLVSQLHASETESINRLFSQTGFWHACREAPFRRDQWVAAIRKAPQMKNDFYTILSEAGRIEQLLQIMHDDPIVQDCFTDS
jgi:glycerol-1-phosphate dehydrogenase [NAD(P)+]